MNLLTKGKNWFVKRLKEVTTWQGLITGLTALGVSISPELAAAIVGSGVAVFTLVSTIWPEKK